MEGPGELGRSKKPSDRSRGPRAGNWGDLRPGRWSVASWDVRALPSGARETQQTGQSKGRRVGQSHGNPSVLALGRTRGTPIGGEFKPPVGDHEVRGCPETVSANGRRSKPPGGFRSGRAAGDGRSWPRRVFGREGGDPGKAARGEDGQQASCERDPHGKASHSASPVGPDPARSPCPHPGAKSLPNQGVAVVLPRGLPRSPALLSIGRPGMPSSNVAWRLCCSLHPEHSPRRYLRGLLPHLREVFVPRSLQDGLLQPPTCNALACVIYLRTSFASDIFLLCFF